MDRKAYSTDLTDPQWTLIDSFLRAWKAKRPSPSGHEGRYQMREIVNGLFYQNRTGCQWQLLPHDLPPWSAVYYYFKLWRDDGTDQAIHDLLRCQVREKAGRAEDPSAVALDTQSVRAANHVPAATTGKDAAKRVPGRKRGLAVDALGLIIAVVVMAASATDNQIGVQLIDRVVAHTPTVTKAWVDAGFKDDVAIHGAVHGIDVEQVLRSDSDTETLRNYLNLQKGISELIALSGIRALTRAKRTTVLNRAARLVAELNEAQPRCIESVALLERVAELVHIRAEPVPVAVAVQGPRGSCLLGQAVDGVIPLVAGGTVMRSPTFDLWDGTGHLVLDATQEQMLFDPTLDQVNAATGFPRGALIMPVARDDFNDSDVTFEINGGCQVLYRVVRGDSAWRTAYNAQHASLGRLAREAAKRALELEGFDENLL